MRFDVDPPDEDKYEVVCPTCHAAELDACICGVATCPICDEALVMDLNAPYCSSRCKLIAEKDVWP